MNLSFFSELVISVTVVVASVSVVVAVSSQVLFVTGVLIAKICSLVSFFTYLILLWWGFVRWLVFGVDFFSLLNFTVSKTFMMPLYFAVKLFVIIGIRSKLPWEKREHFRTALKAPSKSWTFSLTSSEVRAWDYIVLMGVLVTGTEYFAWIFLKADVNWSRVSTSAWADDAKLAARELCRLLLSCGNLIHRLTKTKEENIVCLSLGWVLLLSRNYSIFTFGMKMDTEPPTLYGRSEPRAVNLLCKDFRNCSKYSEKNIWW